MKTLNFRFLILAFAFPFLEMNGLAASVRADNIQVSGGLNKGQAELIISANLLDPELEKESLLYTTRIDEKVEATDERIVQVTQFHFERVRGSFSKLEIPFHGTAAPFRVEGDKLESWSIRHLSQSERVLELNWSAAAKEDERKSITAFTHHRVETLPLAFELTAWDLKYASLTTGEILLIPSASLQFSSGKVEGLILQAPAKSDDPVSPLRYHFYGVRYRASFRLSLRDPSAYEVYVKNTRLDGSYENDALSFTLKGVVSTDNPQGGSLMILSGDVAIVDYQLPEEARIEQQDGAYHLKLDRPGSFPFECNFAARIDRGDRNHKTQFQLPRSVLFPIQLAGYDKNTELRFPGGGTIERVGPETVRSFVPASGRVSLEWSEREEVSSSKLFYNTQSHTMIQIGTGVMRQNTHIDLRIMQGELESVEFDLQGEGEITRVTAPGLLSWDMSQEDNGDRRLVVRFNQAQKAESQISITTVATVADFPVEVNPLRITPTTSDRHHGLIQVVNDGAVRLNVIGTSGLSRINPDTMGPNAPKTERSQGLAKQRFAFRHSSGSYSLAVQASMIQPEISASALLLYFLEYDQTRIEADFEIDIREAPIRDFNLQLPPAYVLADVSTHKLADFFLTPLPGDQGNRLKLVFSEPVLGRHQIRLRLERNAPLAGNDWTLGRLIPESVRQIRGHVGVSSIEGYRLTPGTFTGLAEIATVYFPKKLQGLQAAFRITEADWNLSLDTEVVPQTLQVDAFHMFTLGNGLVRGSSLMHFEISGAPLDTLEFEVPSEYQNLEFTGDNVRTWSQNENNYSVALQTPIIGSYSLLATFERSYDDTNDALVATGITPLGTANEQGTVVVTSNRQIELSETTGSTALVRLTPEELTAENRLLIQQPVLAAYQYTERPFALGLGIRNLAEADTRTQVVDRAAVETRIAKDGQSVSQIHYIVKTSDEPHLQMTLAAETQLWSVSVDGEKVVPIQSGDTTLIPLPPDGEDLRVIDIRVANTSSVADLVRIELPKLNIPVLHTSWNAVPAPKQRLQYVDGNTALLSEPQVRGGFAQLRSLFSGTRPWRNASFFELMMAGLVIAVAVGLLMFTGSKSMQPSRWGRRLCTTLAVIGVIGGTLSIGLNCLDAFDRIQPANDRIESQSSVTPAASQLYLVVENRPQGFIAKDAAAVGGPLVLAIVLAIWSRSLQSRSQQMLTELLAWSIGILGLLQSEYGGPIGLFALVVFLLRHFCWPVIRHSGQGVSTESAKQLACILFGIGLFANNGVAATENAVASVPNRVAQEIHIEGGYVMGKVKLVWQAEKNTSVEILRAPAFITSMHHAPDATMISQAGQKSKAQKVTALKTGKHEIEFDYQLPLANGGNGGNATAFTLPTQYGIINEIKVELVESNVELVVPNAISIKRTSKNGETSHAWTVIPPAENGLKIQWRPRSRDRSEETPVYFAEWTHLLTPSSGLVEGFHDLAIRPAQGELDRVVVSLPESVTINDVIANDLAQWRFDPDKNQVRVELSQAQSKPFLIRILSQTVTQPLPYNSTHTFPHVEGAAGEVGSVALSAEKDIQVSDVLSEALVAIDLQDFQTVLLDLCREQFPGATLRRTFRYTGSGAKLTFQADEVAPHVSIQTSERLSIGADRILLASKIEATIARAGIFSLSFILPRDLSIDSISGEQLSHWSEFVEDDDRQITLHLKQRWQGALSFDVTLTGAGISSADNWVAPKLIIREANRQRGRLTLIPEQGIRLRTLARDNTSQIDAQTGGFKASGALAFELLNTEWNLTFGLEQVAPWVEVTSLQDVLLSDGKATVTTFVDCQIKNTAINQLQLLLPGNATNVRFEGEHLGNTNRSSQENAPRQNWAVQLNRRVIGAYRLLVSYQLRLPDESVPVSIQGVQLQQTSSQRGFLSLRSQGRLQIQPTQTPEALYPTAWSNVPRNLRDSMPEDVTIARSYRIVDPAFEFPLSYTRHEIASVLPAQVKDFNLVTIISPSGSSLTRATIHIVPGSKRNLEFTLPSDHEYWFARVNSQAVATWRNQDTFSVPLTQTLSEESEAVVEIFSQRNSPFAVDGQLNAQLECLNIDLPSNAVTWMVVLDSSWNLKQWAGDLELINQNVLKRDGSDINAFIEEELNRRRGKTQQAEDWLVQGNRLLSEGNDLLARNAFKNAYGLTQHDAAFNEDARVQLRTVKTRQAMAGISVQQRQRNANLAVTAAPQSQSQQSAQQILANASPANENTLLNLADRLIEQHEDTTSIARSFDITFPLQGTELTFVKSVQVNAASTLRLSLQADQDSPKANVATAMGLILILVSAVGIRYRFGAQA